MAEPGFEPRQNSNSALHHTVLHSTLAAAAAAAKSLQSCPTLCHPIDGSPPGSSVHGIFQARVLEWGAIPFSGLFGSPMQIMGWRPIWQDFDNPDQIIQASSVQFSSVAQSCLTLCDPMNHSMPGLLVHHQLPEFTQTWRPSSQ